VLACKSELAGIRNACFDPCALGERNVLRLDQRGHQVQVVADCVAGGKFTQAPGARSENLRRLRQADARNRSLGQGFDLAGLEYALQGWWLA